MIATCPVHGTRIDLSQPPRRVVSFVSSAAERGWTLPRIEAGVDCGRNPIHDGPGFLGTAFWLREQLSRAMEVQA